MEGVGRPSPDLACRYDLVVSSWLDIDLAINVATSIAFAAEGASEEEGSYGPLKRLLSSPSPGLLLAPSASLCLSGSRVMNEGSSWPA
jgi:hypothetical protein